MPESDLVGAQLTKEGAEYEVKQRLSPSEAQHLFDRIDQILEALSTHGKNGRFSRLQLVRSFAIIQARYPQRLLLEPIPPKATEDAAAAEAYEFVGTPPTDGRKGNGRKLAARLNAAAWYADKDVYYDIGGFTRQYLIVGEPYKYHNLSLRNIARLFIGLRTFGFQFEDLFDENDPSTWIPVVEAALYAVDPTKRPSSSSDEAAETIGEPFVPPAPASAVASHIAHVPEAAKVEDARANFEPEAGDDRQQSQHPVNSQSEPSRTTLAIAASQPETDSAQQSAITARRKRVLASVALVAVGIGLSQLPSRGPHKVAPPPVEEARVTPPQDQLSQSAPQETTLEGVKGIQGPIAPLGSNGNLKAQLGENAGVNLSINGAAPTGDLDRRIAEAMRLRAEGKVVAADELSRDMIADKVRRRKLDAKSEAEGHRQLAESAYAHKNYDGSIDERKSAASLDANPHDYNEIGAIYNTLGDFDNALANYDKSIRLAREQNIKFAWPYNNMGNVYLERDPADPKLAMQYYDQALLIDPKLASAYNNRGNALKLDGQPDEALKAYSEAIGIAPEYPDPYNGRGSVFYERNDYDEAIANYTLALEADPEFATALVNRGYAYFVTQKFGLAIEDLTKALQLIAATGARNAKLAARAHAALGSAYNISLRYDEAITEFKAALHLDPRAAIAAAGLGSSYASLGKFEEALRSFADAALIDPKYYPTYLMRSGLFIQRKDFKSALADAETLVQLAPDEAWSFFTRGAARAGIGDDNGMQNDLSHAEQLAKDPVSTAFVKAMKSYLEKKYDHALEALEFLCSDATNPNGLVRFGALEMRAWINFLKKDFSGAVADYSKVIALYPKEEDYVRRANAYIELQESETKILSDVREALRLDPNSIEAYSTRVEYFFRTLQFEKGIVDLEVIIGLKPDEQTLARAHLALANCLTNGPGNTERALQNYQIAIELGKFPTNINARLARANLSEQLEKFDAALDDYREILKTFRWSYVYGRRARAFRAVGRLEDAISDQMAQKAMNPRDPGVYDALGDTYFAMRNYVEAINQYATALEVDPKYLVASFDLGNAYWAVHQPDQAIKSYRQAVPDSEIGSRAALRLFLMNASSELEPAKAELEKTGASLKNDDPYFPLVELYLGRRTVEKLNAERLSPCDINYYVGRWYKLHGNREASAAAFNAGRQSCPKVSIGYYEALVALDE
jgi:tetratricopeptide (TPR) repeat protein